MRGIWFGECSATGSYRLLSRSWSAPPVEQHVERPKTSSTSCLFHAHACLLVVIGDSIGGAAKHDPVFGSTFCWWIEIRSTDSTLSGATKSPLSGRQPLRSYVGCSKPAENADSFMWSAIPACWLTLNSSLIATPSNV